VSLPGSARSDRSGADRSGFVESGLEGSGTPAGTCRAFRMDREVLGDQDRRGSVRIIVPLTIFVPLMYTEPPSRAVVRDSAPDGWNQGIIRPQSLLYEALIEPGAPRPADQRRTWRGCSGALHTATIFPSVRRRFETRPVCEDPCITMSATDGASLGSRTEHTSGDDDLFEVTPLWKRRHSS